MNNSQTADDCKMDFPIATRILSFENSFWIKKFLNPLLSTTLIGPVAFGGRELYVLVLHSAGPDIY